MSEQRTFRLRITFRKAGRCAMLSHLELARALERTVRRAGLPYAVSQGFSPHMRISFGAALPVGVGGLQEVCDVQLRSYVAPEAALAALQDASPADLMPSACRYVEPGAAAPSVALPLGDYEARLSDAPSRLAAPETVTVMRKRKERVLQVADFLVGDLAQDGNRVTFTLRSRQEGSLRADRFLAACLQAAIDEGAAPEGMHVLELVRVAQREEG